MCTQNVPTTHGNLVHTCIPLPVLPTMQMAAIVLLEGGEDGERKSVNNGGGQWRITWIYSIIQYQPVLFQHVKLFVLMCKEDTEHR